MKMSFVAWCSVLALTAALSACGDDDGGKGTNNNGDSGPNGSMNDAAAGGDASSGGGDGGPWTQPAMCPAQAPRDNTACMQAPLECRYGRNTCLC